MELVETVRDVEAVLHCQGCVVGVGGGRTGMVGNDERFSDLIGGLYTPLGSANLSRTKLAQTLTKARKTE